MLEYGLFVVFGAFEIFAVFVLIFTLFCFPIRENIIQLVLCSFIPALSSYTLRMAHLDSIDIVFQNLLVFLVLWLLFQVPVLYAFIVLVVGYVSYVVVQIAVVLSLELMRIFNWEDMTLNSWPAYCAQLLSVLFAIVLAYGLHQNRLHFSFVPHYHHVKMKVLQGTKLLLLLSVMTMLVIVTFITLYSWNHSYILVVFSGVLNMALVFGLFVFAYQKDVDEFRAKLDRG